MWPCSHMLGVQSDRPQSFSLDWEQCIVKESKVSSLAGADESLFSLSGVVSLATRISNTAYRAHFVMADRLAKKVLIGT